MKLTFYEFSNVDRNFKRTGPENSGTSPVPEGLFCGQGIGVVRPSGGRRDFFPGVLQRSAGIAEASVCIRLDQEGLARFRAQGKGCQTRINARLRAYMEAQTKG